MEGKRECPQITFDELLIKFVCSGFFCRGDIVANMLHSFRIQESSVEGILRALYD